MNYKRPACYERCPGNFGYIFVNLLLKVSGGAVLSQKNFLFPYDIFIFSADSKC